MEGFDLHRFIVDMVGRAGGPMTFRFFLQPMMAALAAWHDGWQDAKKGNEPYLRRLRLSDHTTRWRIWREGVTAVTRVLLLGVGMDVIYQLKVFGAFKHPLETLVIAIALAFLPYLLFRGVATRLATRWVRRHRTAR